MATSHVVGGGVAAAIGAVAVSVVNHFTHLQLSDPDAVIIGGAAVSAGAGLAHVIEQVGILGIFRRILRGAPAPAQPVVVMSHDVVVPAAVQAPAPGPGVAGA